MKNIIELLVISIVTILIVRFVISPAMRWILGIRPDPREDCEGHTHICDVPVKKP